MDSDSRLERNTQWTDGEDAKEKKKKIDPLPASPILKNKMEKEKTNPPPLFWSGRQVEMAGIEPASERIDPRTSTSVARL